MWIQNHTRRAVVILGPEQKDCMSSCMSKEYQAFLGLLKSLKFGSSTACDSFHKLWQLISDSVSPHLHVQKYSPHHDTCTSPDAIKPSRLVETGFWTTKSVITHLQKDYCQWIQKLSLFQSQNFPHIFQAVHSWKHWLLHLSLSTLPHHHWTSLNECQGFCDPAVD